MLQFTRTQTKIRILWSAPGIRPGPGFVEQQTVGFYGLRQYREKRAVQKMGNHYHIETVRLWWLRQHIPALGMEGQPRCCLLDGGNGRVGVIPGLGFQTPSGEEQGISPPTTGKIQRLALCGQQSRLRLEQGQRRCLLGVAPGIAVIPARLPLLFVFRHEEVQCS